MCRQPGCSHKPRRRKRGCAHRPRPTFLLSCPCSCPQPPPACDLSDMPHRGFITLNTVGPLPPGSWTSGLLCLEHALCPATAPIHICVHTCMHTHVCTHALPAPAFPAAVWSLWSCRDSRVLRAGKLERKFCFERMSNHFPYDLGKHKIQNAFVENTKWNSGRKEGFRKARLVPRKGCRSFPLANV